MNPTDRPSPPALTSNQRRHLRGLAHGLAAVVHVGKQGFTPAVRLQLDAALEDHELIKVRLAAARPARPARPAIAAMLVDATGAEHVGSIGGVLILYRRRADAERRSIVLPT